jgi:hypothetical protein
LLASYTSLFEKFDARTDNSLDVRWFSPVGSAVHIRGYSLKGNTYYQMDAAPDPEKNLIVWPLDIVHDAQLTRPDLAVAAWASYKAGGRMHDVYVPVEITHSRAVTRPSRASAEIILLPGRPLTEVYLTVRSLNADLMPSSSKPILEEEPLGDFSYPDGIPIPVSLERLKISETGFYSIKFGATAKNGLPATLTITLYYARR